MTKSGKDANDLLRELGVDGFREHMDQEIWRQIKASRANGSNGNGHTERGNGHAELPPFDDIDPSEPISALKRDYMDGKTKLACNVGNVRLALDQELALMNRFAFNEMTRTNMLMRPFGDDLDFKPRSLTDEDITSVQTWLQWFRFRKLGEKPVRDAVKRHARDHSFHPIRDYLDRCAANWDGTPRIGTWLHVYAGAALITNENGESTGYIERVGEMFLIGMVARIYKPGCKFDYMLILEGRQGLEKSKMCEALAGEDYFSDQLPDIAHKDASQHMRGKWLIEMAEMHAYSRAKIDHYKEFMSRRIERYRPPYGHCEVIEPRQCAFVGTTNKLVYLRDETGNRRSWPVAAGEIDVESLKRDRDQLWGEVVHLFRRGVQWWPDWTFEKEHIQPQQEARFEPDPWEKLIKKDHLKPLIDGYWARMERAAPGAQIALPKTSLLDIAENVLGFTTSNTQQQGELKTPIVRLEPKVTQRIGAVLHHLGWVPKHDKHGSRWWEPSPEAMESEV
jgi:predicted P-loop ATPase